MLQYRQQERTFFYKKKINAKKKNSRIVSGVELSIQFWMRNEQSFSLAWVNNRQDFFMSFWCITRSTGFLRVSFFAGTNTVKVSPMQPRVNCGAVGRRHSKTSLGYSHEMFWSSRGCWQAMYVNQVDKKVREGRHSKIYRMAVGDFSSRSCTLRRGSFTFIFIKLRS